MVRFKKFDTKNQPRPQGLFIFRYFMKQSLKNLTYWKWWRVKKPWVS